MSIQMGRLVSQILLEHFGEDIKSVASDLFLHGLTSIPFIVKSTGLKRSQVVESLRVLIKYSLLTFEPSLSDLEAEYKISSENILNIIKYPKYLGLIRNAFSVEAETIVEEILKSGMADTLEIINNLMESNKNNEDLGMYLVLLRDNFIKLVKAGYLKAAPNLSPLAEGTIPLLLPTFVESHVQVLPDIDIRSVLEKKIEDNKDKKYWMVDFSRFHRDFRDSIIITAVNRRIDDCAAELMRILLDQMYLRTDPWVAYSNPIPLVEIKDACKQSAAKFPLLLQYLDQYLKVLEENSNNFISKCGDAAGGQYRVNLKTSIELLTWNIIENTVLERLGSKAARIFRLIKLRKYVEEDDIQKHAMLPAKEAKQFTYKLMEEHFINIQVMRKTGTSGSGPTKAVYLYHIDQYQVAGMLLEMTYKALYNCMKRKECEKANNRRILDKQQRVKTIIEGMKEREEPEENIKDVEETITPPEKAVLQKTHDVIRKFDIAEMELDNTIFLLHMYFLFKTKA